MNYQRQFIVGESVLPSDIYGYIYGYIWIYERIEHPVNWIQNLSISMD